MDEYCRMEAYRLRNEAEPRPAARAARALAPAARRLGLALAAVLALCAPAPAGEVPPPDAFRAPAEPTGLLTLADAVAAALVGNPDLAAYSWEVRVHEARAVQAGLLPNPELRADVENVGGSGNRQAFEETETTLRLTQLVELGGKRARRRRVAELGQALSSFDYEARRLSVLSETAKAFVATLAAQEELALAHELERLGADAVRNVEQMVSTGAAPAVELARTRVASGRAVVARQRAERELEAARRGLAVTWGGSRPAFTRAVGALGDLGRIPSEEDVFRRLERNPDLARWKTEREERAAAVALAEATRVPNVTVGAGGRHFSDTGDNALVFELSVPLPVLNRNQGAVAEARARLGKVRAELEAADVSLRRAVAEAYERLRGAHEEVTALRRSLLPEAEGALKGAAEGFRKGLFRLTDVLDAQRTLFDLRAEELHALEAYHLAAADLDRLTASHLENGGDGEREGEGETR